MERDFLNLIIGIYKKTANIILSDIMLENDITVKRLNTFPTIKNEARISALATSVQHGTTISSQGNWGGNYIKDSQIEKENIKLPLCEMI